MTLTDAQVLDLRQRVMDGETFASLGARFAISPHTARRIWSGRHHSYDHLPRRPPPWEAACMDSTEWEEWKQMNRGGAVHGIRPCADCPLAYAADMRRLGRCNGSPEVVSEEPELVA